MGFFEVLFGNAGKKIKAIAIIAFIIELIASLIIAISAANDAWRNEGFIFFTTFFGCIVTSYISTLFIIGFAEIVDFCITSNTSAYKNSYFSGIEQKRENYTYGLKYNQPGYGQQTQQSAEWYCSNCGRKNQSYTGTCACGNPKR